MIKIFSIITVSLLLASCGSLDWGKGSNDYWAGVTPQVQNQIQK